MAAADVDTALQTLQQPSTLSIHALSEPILSSTNSSHQGSSSLSTSDDNSGAISPAELQAELAHYKELFSKLRFSYVEQVTKERFLKSIVADPPEPVDARENEVLETQLTEDKAALKAKKGEVAERLQELERLGRDVVQRYEMVQRQTSQLASLPAALEELEATIATLKTSQEPRSDDPELNLSLPATNALVRSRQAEMKSLDAQIAELQELVPARKREVADLESEVGDIEVRKRKAIEQAMEARRKRGGMGQGADDLDLRGRWMKSNEMALRAMLEI